jgi:hypothetical protein
MDWITTSVLKNKMPKPFVEVLVWHRNYGMMMETYWDDDACVWVRNFDDYDPEDITHWMPYPLEPSD